MATRHSNICNEDTGGVVVFIAIYAALSLFLIRYARKIEKNPKASLVYNEDCIQKVEINDNYLDLKTIDTNKLNRATKWFGFIILCIFILILSTSIVEGLSDYSLPIVGLLFLIGINRQIAV